MKTITPLQSTRLNRSPSRVAIRRLGTIEDELNDRILREQNGTQVFRFCQKLGALLVVSYSPGQDRGDVFREEICANLMVSLNCSPAEAANLVELALDLVHAKLYHQYRRQDPDIASMVSRAAQALAKGKVN